jgi:hypothetical protein
MTRDMNIIYIFRQNMHFLNDLIVLRVRVQALAVCRATYKTANSLMN